MAKSTSTYLNNLKFDNKIDSSFIARYLKNPRLVFLLVISIILIGITSLIQLPRTLNPEVDITFVTVSAVLPGADPTEVEELITIPLEDAVESVDKVTSITSTSTESVSVISLEFETGTDPKIAEQDVTSAINSVNDLPDNATTPNVSSFDFENQPVLVSSIATKGDAKSLINVANVIKEKLEDDPQIDRVLISGTQEEEIQILIDPADSFNYRLNPLAIKSQISSGLSSLPAGAVSTTSNNFTFNIGKTISDVDDIRKLPINTGITTLPLDNFADVTIRTKPDQLPSYSIDENGDIQTSVVISVFKARGTKIDEVGGTASTIIENELTKYNGDFNYHVSLDLSEDISTQFSDLISNFSQTLVLVFLTLLIFLGIRQSLIVALSIPLTFFISFIAMSLFGLSLNFLSVFSLLLALGLLVDDAIVITSAISAYDRTKKFTSTQTGLLVWRDYIVPIWSTTITTVWAFIPLLLASGIIGAFIKTIPIVVSASLIGSTTVAVLITLPTSMYLLDGNVPSRVVKMLKALLFISLIALFIILVPKEPFGLYAFGLVVYILFVASLFKNKDEFISNVKGRTNDRFNIKQKLASGFIDSQKLSAKYKKKISEIIANKSSRRKVAFGVVAFSLLSYMLVPLGFVKNEFFPKIDTKLVYVALELPIGTKYTKTDDEAKEILRTLSEYNEVEYVLAEVGRLPNQFGVAGSEGENTARFSINLKEENSIEFSQSLREDFKDYDKGEISIIEESGGPPVGADVQITFKGDDLVELSHLAEDVEDKLAEIDGTTNIKKSISTSTSRVNFIPDEKKLASLGISKDQIGLSARTYVSGLEVDEITIDDKNYDIYIRNYTSRPDITTLSKIMIQTQSGLYPINSLGKLVPETSPSIISREDGKRVISVTAGVEAGYSVSEINAQIGEYANSLELQPGYTWETGGVNEENNESIFSILQGMILAAILILATMVVQLGSFRKAIIVLLVIPLAISGVFVAFAITGTPLSFPALIGLLALFGIVVNNSIVVVEKINQNLRVGINFDESVADGAASRVEPIMFSSLTTIFGLLPITLSDPLWRGLGGAIIAGLLVSGSIMLIFIPTVYYSWFSSESKTKRKKRS